MEAAPFPIWFRIVHGYTSNRIKKLGSTPEMLLMTCPTRNVRSDLEVIAWSLDGT